MFKEPVLLLPSDIINILLKGGDFMGIEGNNAARERAVQKEAYVTAFRDAVERTDWEGGPLPGEVNPEVLDGRSDPTHPLVRGRTRANIPTPWEIAAGDPVDLKCVIRMDGGE